MLRKQILVCSQQLVRLAEAYYPKVCRTRCCANMLSTLTVELDSTALKNARQAGGCGEGSVDSDIHRVSRMVIEAKTRRAHAKTVRESLKELSLPYRPLMDRVEDCVCQTDAVLDSLVAARVLHGAVWLHPCLHEEAYDAINDTSKEIEHLIMVAKAVYPKERNEATSSSSSDADPLWLDAPSLSVGCRVQVTSRADLAEICTVIQRPNIAQCPPSLTDDLRSISHCVVLVELESSGELCWLQASDLQPHDRCSPVVVDLQHPLAEEPLNLLWHQTGKLLSMLATVVEDFSDELSTHRNSPSGNQSNLGVDVAEAV